jgi:hypothetical protein
MFRTIFTSNMDLLEVCTSYLSLEITISPGTKAVALHKLCTLANERTLRSLAKLERRARSLASTFFLSPPRLIFNFWLPHRLTGAANCVRCQRTHMCGGTRHKHSTHSPSQRSAMQREGPRGRWRGECYPYARERRPLCLAQGSFD